jgi:hypothetical protein
MLSKSRLMKFLLIGFMLVNMFFVFNVSGVYAAPITVDDTSGSITYSGTWTTWTASGDYGGSDKYCNTVGAYTQFTFTGTSIKWISPKADNYGKADVYIDGVLDQSGIDCYSASKVYQQVVYSKTGLSNASHTIKVVVTGTKNPSSSDTYIVIDAFQYDTSSGIGTAVTNNTDWYDTSSNRIIAHDGGITRVGNTFYWYGSDYTNNPTGRYGTDARNAGIVNPFRIYSSTDLVNWQYRGIAFNLPTSGFGSTGSIHRPHVIYNSTTGKYVMWFFEFRSTYPDIMAGVATADYPQGPFTVIGQRSSAAPYGYAQDLNVFKDTDGSAYLIHDSGAYTIRVDRLSSDYLSVTGSTVVAIDPSSNGGKGFEGPAMVKFKGKYLVTASEVHGWSPSPTWAALADNPMGPYTAATIVTSGSANNVQNSSLLYISESDTCFQIGDSWFNPNTFDLNQSRYYFMPVTVNPLTNTASINYVTQYNPLTGQSN